MNIIPNHVQLSNRFCVYWVSAEIFSEKFNNDQKLFWEMPYLNRLRMSDIVIKSGEVVKTRFPIETLITMALSPNAFYSDCPRDTDGPRMERCIDRPSNAESIAAAQLSDRAFDAEAVLQTWREEWSGR